MNTKEMNTKETIQSQHFILRQEEIDKSSKAADKHLLAPKLESSVLLRSNEHFFSFSKKEIIFPILKDLQSHFPRRVSSYLGGSAIINTFGGRVYHSVADLDWTIIINPDSFDPSETLAQAQARIINTLASTLFFAISQTASTLGLPIAQPVMLLSLELMGVRQTIPVLSDRTYCARYCFASQLNDIPLELCLHVRKEPLSRLMYDLYIPLQAFNRGLGSRDEEHFHLHSSDCSETTDIETVLHCINNKVIIYNPDPNLTFPDRNKWLRLQVAITEGSIAPSSNINVNWLQEAERAGLLPKHITEWAQYKRKGIVCYPFFLSLNALFSTHPETPLSRNILIHCFQIGQSLTGHPLFSWIKYLISFFEINTATNETKKPSVYSNLLILLKLFLPYFADQFLLIKHSHQPHLRLGFGNTSPFFVLLPIQNEIKIAFYSQYEIKLLLSEEKFVDAAEKMLEYPLAIPEEIDAIFCLAQKIPDKQFSCRSHILAMLFWKTKSALVHLLHLKRALKCGEQELVSCQTLLMEEHDPFSFETTIHPLDLPDALLLVSQQLALFGPNLPLDFYCSCIRKGIVTPIHEACLQALASTTAKSAWEAYPELASIPSLADAIEKKLLAIMPDLAKEELKSDLYLPILQKRIEETGVKRGFKLTLAAKCLRGLTFDPLPPVLRFFHAFPTEKALIVDHFPELSERLDQEETRLLLLGKKLDGAPLLNALISRTIEHLSQDELSTIALEMLNKVTQLTHHEFDDNHQILFSFFQKLHNSVQDELLVDWLKTIFSRYQPFLHQFSPSFWSDLHLIVKPKIKNEKVWKKLFISLVLLLPPREETALFLTALNEATLSISNDEFPIILPKENLDKRWIYYFKAFCHLKKIDATAAFSYLEAMLELPYQGLEKRSLGSLSEDSFDFQASFNKLSSPQKILALLAYQENVSEAAQILPFYLAACRRFPKSKDVCAAFGFAVIRALESQHAWIDPNFLWEIYPIVYEIDEAAEKIEAIDFRRQAESESNKALYTEIIKNRFRLSQMISNKQNHLLLLSLMNEEAEISKLLAEEFCRTNRIADEIHEWYARFSLQIASQLQGEMFHHFVWHFPEDNRSIGWRKLLEDPRSCHLRESQLYLKAATREEQSELIFKLLHDTGIPHSKCRDYFDLIVSSDSDLFPLLSLHSWTREALTRGMSLLSSREEKSKSLKSLFLFILHHIPSYINEREMVQRIFLHLDDQEKSFAIDRLTEECERDLKNEMNLQKNLHFLLTTEIGKLAIKTEKGYSVLLKIIDVTDLTHHIDELLKILKKPLHFLPLPLPNSPLEFTQTACVWKAFISSKKRPKETFEWLVDKLAHLFTDVRYFTLCNVINKIYPDFTHLILNKRIHELDTAEQPLSLCFTLPYMRHQDFKFCAQYLHKRYARSPNHEVFAYTKKLIHAAIKQKKMPIVLFLVKNILLVHAEKEEITPQNAFFYLQFFIEDANDEIMGEDPKISSLFLQAAAQYLRSDSCSSLGLEAIFKTIQKMHPKEKPMNEMEWAITMTCIERLDKKIKISPHRIQQTLGLIEVAINPHEQNKLLQLIPDSAPFLLLQLRRYALTPQSFDRIRDLCSFLSSTPIPHSNIYSLQEIIHTLFSYIQSHLENHPEQFDLSCQECIQSLILLAFKCKSEEKGMEIAYYLYTQLPSLNRSHLNFLEAHHLHCLLFRDCQLCLAFLQLANQCFKEKNNLSKEQKNDQTLENSTLIFLVESRFHPIYNRENLQNMSFLYCNTLMMNFHHASDPSLKFELALEQIPQNPEITIFFQIFVEQLEALSLPQSGEETFLQQLENTLSNLHHSFLSLTNEQTYLLYSKLPSIISFLLKIFHTSPNSNVLAYCSKYVIEISRSFSELSHIRTLGRHIHQPRLFNFISGENNQLFQLDLDMYLLYLGTFFDSSFLLSPTAFSSYPDNRFDNWIRLFIRVKNQPAYDLVSQYLIFAIEKFIQSGTKCHDLVKLTHFMIKFITGTITEDLPLPKRETCAPKVLEFFIFFVYLHSTEHEQHLLFERLLLSLNREFLMETIQEGMKRKEQSPEYCFKIAIMGVKLLNQEKDPLSPLEEKSLNVTLGLLNHALEYPWNTHQALDFSTLCMNLIWTQKIPLEQVFIDEIFDKISRVIAETRESNPETLRGISSFALYALPYCPDYSTNPQPITISKEVIMRVFIPLIRYDIFSFLLLNSSLVSSKICSQPLVVIKDSIHEIGRYLKEPDFFSEELDSLNQTSFSMAAEVHQQLQLFLSTM